VARILEENLIKRVQSGLPRGSPFDLAALASLGVSPILAAYYVKSGWLVRLAHGVYGFPNDTLEISGVLRFLQQRVSGLHIGGRSALARQGVSHNLRQNDALVIWGNMRFALPEWITTRFPARYVSARLFDWPDTHLAKETLHIPPGQSDGVWVSVSERASLEMLDEVGTRESLEETRNVFDGLRSPRKAVLGELLSCCRSVKAVRLFLTWARETGCVDVDALLAQYPIRTGSDKRWMSRLGDGTLLSLKPHG